MGEERFRRWYMKLGDGGSPKGTDADEQIAEVGSTVGGGEEEPQFRLEGPDYSPVEVGRRKQTYDKTGFK